MPIDEPRKKALELLRKYLTGEVDGRDVMPQWPSGYEDALLDNIINTFVEPVDDNALVSHEDIVSASIRAIKESWTSESYDEFLDRLEQDRKQRIKKARSGRWFSGFWMGILVI